MFTRFKEIIEKKSRYKVAKLTGLGYNPIDRMLENKKVPKKYEAIIDKLDGNVGYIRAENIQGFEDGNYTVKKSFDKEAGIFRIEFNFNK